MSDDPTTSKNAPKLAGDNGGPKLDGTHIISSFADGSNPWEEGIKLSREYDDEMCEMLRDELENLLLFAALFSAIVTSFAVVSYQWLQPNNSNNSSPVSYPLAVQINFLWFLSLGASLSVSSIGILCMQWVRQYRRWKARMDKRTAALRRQRYEGFLLWHVPNIVAALPVILQIALVLFGIGVNSLLWSLHHVVAVGFAVVSVPALVLIVVTTLAPAFQWLLRQKTWWTSQCPYQSPQAWLVYLLARALAFWNQKSDHDWEEFDRSWLESSTEVLEAGRNDHTTPIDYEIELLCQEIIWLDHEYADNVIAIKARAQALRQLPFHAAKRVVVTLFRNLKIDHKITEAVSQLQYGRDFHEAETERNLKHLKVWYLWGHAQTHPSLDAAYMEARIDFMSEIPTLKIDLPGRPRAAHLDVQCLVKDEFLVPRFLHCLKVMISFKRLKKETSKEMWAIVGDLLEYSIRHAYSKYFDALGSLFKALSTRLEELDVLHLQDQGNGGSSAVSVVNGGQTPTSLPQGVPRISSASAPSVEQTWYLTAEDTVNDMLDGLRFFFALHADQKIGHLNEEDADHMEPLLGLITFLNTSVKPAMNVQETSQGHLRPPANTKAEQGSDQPLGPGPQGDAVASQAQGIRNKRRLWKSIRPKVLAPMQNAVKVAVQRKKDDNWEQLVVVLTKWATPKAHPGGGEPHKIKSGNGVSHTTSIISGGGQFEDDGVGQPSNFTRGEGQPRHPQAS